MNKNVVLALLVGIALVMMSACEKKAQVSSLYEIEENGLYGYIDSVGNKVIEPQFMYASFFREGLALVVVDTVYGERLDSAHYKYEGKAITKRPYLCAKYGYIDKSGEFVIKPTLTTSFYIPQEIYGKYDFKTIGWFDKFAFHFNRALHQDSTTLLYGYIDKTGEEVIPSVYLSGNSFHQSRAVVLKYTGKALGPENLKYQYGIIDKDNNVIADFEYHDITNYNSNHTIARKWEKSREMGPQDVISENEKGEYDIRKEYFRESWADVVLILNKQGEITDSLSPGDEYFGFCEGISVARNMFLSSTYTNVYEYVDTLGHFLEPLNGISESQAEEMLLSKQAFTIVSKEDNIIGCTRFSNNLAGTTLNGHAWAFVDRNLLVRGTETENIYEYIQPFNDGLAPVKKEGKWGYVNTALKQVIPCKYDSCEINYGFLEKVYNFKKDSVISMYINRSDSIVWSHTGLRGYDNKYVNRFSQKDKKKYGQWNDDMDYGDGILQRYIGVIIVVLIVIVIGCIVIKNRRKKG